MKTPINKQTRVAINSVDISPGRFGASQLREIADLMDKRQADASAVVDIDFDCQERAIGDIFDGNYRMPARQFTSKKIMIEVQIYSPVEVLLPNGEWVTYE